MEQRPQTPTNQRLRAYDDTEAFAEFGHERRDRVEACIDCARADIRHMHAVLTQLDMQRTSEMAQESLRTALRTQTLCRHLTRHRAHIENITLPARLHVLTEEVTQHRRRVHM